MTTRARRLRGRIVPEAMSPRTVKLRYHQTQQSAWECRDLEQLWVAGRGSGKTELAKRKLVCALGGRGALLFFAAPRLNHAKAIAWADLIDLCPPYYGIQVDGSELAITTRFGSRLELVGLDDRKRCKIEGRQWDGGVIDESSDVWPGMVDAKIKPALTHRRGWLLRIGVPKRQGVGAAEYRERYEEAKAGRVAGVSAFHWISADIVPQDVLARFRASMDPKDYREQFEATWEAAGGGVFHAFSRLHNVRPCAYEPSLPLIIGMDFNVDPMCWVIGQVRPMPSGSLLEWIDEIWIRDTNTPATLDVLWAKWGHHPGGFHFYGDSASHQRKTSAVFTDYAFIYNDQRFAKASGGREIDIPITNPAVEDRFAACNSMFCAADGTRRMFVAPGCVRLIADLEQRAFKAGTRELPQDEGMIGHMTDAMGYPVFALFPPIIRLDHVTTSITAISLY